MPEPQAPPRPQAMPEPQVVAAVAAEQKNAARAAEEEQKNAARAAEEEKQNAARAADAQKAADAVEVLARKAERAEAAAREAARKSETVVASARKPQTVVPPAEPVESKDLSGIWELRNAIDTTTYLPYLGLRIAYRVNLEQQGSKLVGTGVKISENGRTLPDGERTSIHLEGQVEGQTVKLNFTERYAGGSTGGVISWNLAPSGDVRGRFNSNAAKSSGISSARRLATRR